MFKFYSLGASVLALCCMFFFSLQSQALEACDVNCNCDSDFGCNCVIPSATSKNVSLNFAFLYTYPNLEEVTFTGVIVTPSQQIYETSILSFLNTEETITLSTPVETGTYTIAFYIKELSPNFEAIELGRMTVTSNTNDETALFVATAERSFNAGQQIVFQYVVTPN
jgi:hypothetical protein